jgi:two-component system, OmpR family, sensor histidine kinase VanS
VELDPFRVEVRRAGRRVPVTRKEFAVLQVLMAAGGGIVSAEAAGRGITFHGHLAPCEAAANLPLLRQAVGNLLANAVRHNTGGGTVEAGTGTGPRHEWARVRIRNTGPVIDPRVIQLLGEPFYRIRPRYRPAGQGHSHGLGLPIALAIAQALGGSLALTANPEGGLTAELRLPAVDAGQLAVPSEAGGIARKPASVRPDALDCSERMR